MTALARSRRWGCGSSQLWTTFDEAAAADDDTSVSMSAISANGRHFEHKLKHSWFERKVRRKRVVVVCICGKSKAVCCEVKISAAPKGIPVRTPHPGDQKQRFNQSHACLPSKIVACLTLQHFILQYTIESIDIPTKTNNKRHPLRVWARHPPREVAALQET